VQIGELARYVLDHPEDANAAVTLAGWVLNELGGEP
jgi:hypothetical protein